MSTQQLKGGNPLTTVKWDDAVIRTRIVKGKPRREKRYPVLCACGRERLLTKYDALRAGQCFHCAQREKGKLGYRATVALHGPDFALEHVQAYLLANPSPNELKVIGILRDMGINHEREVILRYGGSKYLIDFVINGCHAIEVNGGCHILHEARDQRKFNAIRSDGYRLLVLEACDLDRAEEIISDFLNLPSSALGVPA